MVYICETFLKRTSRIGEVVCGRESNHDIVRSVGSINITHSGTTFSQTPRNKKRKNKHGGKKFTSGSPQNGGMKI